MCQRHAPIRPAPWPIGAAADSLDPDPFEWVRRIEFAAEGARIYRRFLGRER